MSKLAGSNAWIWALARMKLAGGLSCSARRSGVPASTLRFYEEKGLIASIGRHGLRRMFDARVLERLALIAVGRAAAGRAPSHMECPSFRRLLQAAMSGTIRAPKKRVPRN